MGDDGGRPCDQHTAEETPVAGPDDEAGRVCGGDPSEHGEGGPGRGGREDGDGLDVGDDECDEVGNGAAKGGGAVDDGDHVEGEVLVGVQAGAGVRGGVEHGDVVGQHDTGEGEGEQHEGRLGEGLPLDEAAGAGASAGPATQDGDGDAGEEEVDEADDADGPAESDLGLKTPEQNGEDDAADAGSDGGDADGNGPFGREVRGDDDQGGDVGDAAAHADAEALCQEDLVELGGQTGHHHAEDDHQVAADDQRPEVSRVDEGAGHDADHDDHGGLDAADPGDVGG